MSTDLSDTQFPEHSGRNLLLGIFDSIRPRLRDAVGDVRFHAAWYDMPWVHKIFKSLHENLTLESDKVAARTSYLKACAERLSLMYPSADRFPHQGDIEKMRETLALEIGSLAPDDDSDPHSVKLDDVLALYHAKYAQEPDSTVGIADYAHDEEMDGWERLNQAVGGDLFSNPDKLAIMRQVDGDPANAELSWDEFHSRVIEAIRECGHAPAPDMV